MGPAGSQWMKSLQIYIDLPTVPVFCSNPFDSLGTDYEFWPHMMSEHLSRHQILTQNVAGEKNLRKKKKKNNHSIHPPSSARSWWHVATVGCFRARIPRSSLRRSAYQSVLKQWTTQILPRNAASFLTEIKGYLV